jgi:hypothetical protein
MRRSVLSVISWDGLLPAFVATLPFVVKLAFHKNDMAELFAAILMPMIASLVRSAVAWGQLARACQGRIPWQRQVAVAIAIVCLLFVEIGVAIGTFAADFPAEGWLWIVGLYIVYLGLMYFSLQPLARA